jgi:hypothetical protein
MAMPAAGWCVRAPTLFDASAHCKALESMRRCHACGEIPYDSLSGKGNAEAWNRNHISTAHYAGGNRAATASGTARRRSLAQVVERVGIPSGPPAAAPAAAISGRRRSACHASRLRRMRPGITIHRMMIERSQKNGNSKPRRDRTTSMALRRPASIKPAARRVWAK